MILYDDIYADEAGDHVTVVDLAGGVSVRQSSPGTSTRLLANHSTTTNRHISTSHNTSMSTEHKAPPATSGEAAGATAGDKVKG